MGTAVPVDGKRLACWLLLGHADNAWGAAVGAAQTRAAHTVGPATHAHALPYLRAHYVPGVHGEDAPAEHQNKSHHEHKASSRHDIIKEEVAYLFGEGGVWRDIVGTPVVGVLWLGS